MYNQSTYCSSVYLPYTHHKCNIQKLFIFYKQQTVGKEKEIQIVKNI